MNNNVPYHTEYRQPSYLNENTDLYNQQQQQQQQQHVQTNHQQDADTDIPLDESVPHPPHLMHQHQHQQLADDGDMRDVDDEDDDDELDDEDDEDLVDNMDEDVGINEDGNRLVDPQQQLQQQQVGDEDEDEFGAGGAFANVGQGLSGRYKNMMMQYWQETINSIEHDEHDFKNHQLPLLRIKKVMKTDEEVRMISAEAPILFAKGCDIFITELTMRAWIHAEENKRRTLQRSDIALLLQKSDMFDFLIDIVPREEEKPKRQHHHSHASVSNNNNINNETGRNLEELLSAPDEFTTLNGDHANGNYTQKINNSDLLKNFQQ